MPRWLHRIYLRWRDRPVTSAGSDIGPQGDHCGAGVIYLKPDKPGRSRLLMNGREVLPVDIGENELRPTPVDHYSASFKATQHALHEALMGHSLRQQEEADAVRDVADERELANDLSAQVYLLVQTESGYTKMRPDEHCEKTIVGVYRTAERAERARTKLRDVIRTSGAGSEHAYYHTIERKDLL